MKIEQTTDYAKFKKIKGNRSFAKTHLKNLIASIAGRNLLEYNPILVNKQMEVIDGQHRLEAAKKLGLPIFYMVVENGGDLDDVILINANLKNWSLTDYLESQILLGNKEYKILKDYFDKYDLPLGACINLLSGQKADSSGTLAAKSTKSPISLFKEGYFIVSNLKEAEFVGERMQEIKPFCDTGVFRERAFIDALMSVYTKIKPSSMIEALERSGLKVPRKALKRDYLLFLEDIYNFRKSTGRQKFY